MHIGQRIRTLSALVMAGVFAFGGLSVSAAKEPLKTDPNSMTFVVDDNLLKSDSTGMIVERDGDSSTLVAYYLAPLNSKGKANKFNYAKGGIAISNSVSSGLYAPVVFDITKKWRVESRAAGANNKVARAKIKNGQLTIDIKGPGFTNVTVSNYGYQAVLPLEVRLPDYSALQLTYGTTKAKKTMTFGPELTRRTEGDSKVYAGAFEMTQGESWTLSVLCEGGAAQIPGLSGNDKLVYAVDKGGNGIWYAKNPAVASVTSAGKLKAVAVGEAEISFQDYMGRIYDFTVEVKPKEANIYTDFRLFVKTTGSFSELKPAENGTLSIELEVGDTATFEMRAKVKGNDKKLTVFGYSEDPNTAYVVGSKTIQGLKAGTTEMTVVALNLPLGSVADDIKETTKKVVTITVK